MIMYDEREREKYASANNLFDIFIVFGIHTAEYSIKGKCKFNLRKMC